MQYVHIDTRQVSRSLWQGWVREYDLHASASTRTELLNDLEVHLTEQYFGSDKFQMIVMPC